ncbi:MAG: zf-HC2 domain-containing protein [Deltaproteobacteria bacterium]
MRKLDCTKAEELIIRDLDEGLDREMAALLESHVSHCSSCRDFREEAASLLASVAADVPDDPGEDFWRYYDVSLEARLREKSLSRPWGFGLKLAGVILAGILAVLVVRWGLMEPQKPRMMDNRVAMLLIQDLNGLYGPVGEEFAIPANPPNQLLEALTPEVSRSDDALVTWFEVEDESDDLLL